jgi:NAD+ kinase
VKIERVLLFVKETSFERLAKAAHRDERARRARLGQERGSLPAVQRAHAEHTASLRQVRAELLARGVDVVERSRAPSRPVRNFDLVISVGGDGTLLQASHAVRSAIPVLGVNSAPTTSVGFLTSCRAPTFARMLDELIAERVQPRVVQRLQVRIGRRRVPEPVLNDVLFCHDNPAVTTRYKLVTPAGEEHQRSSGAWIATPAGSTAALRSAGGPELGLDERRFAFVIREPYAPPGSSVRIRGGILEPGEVLRFESRVEAASVFLDGSHRRYPVPFGTRVSFSLHEHPLRIVRP